LATEAAVKAVTTRVYPVALYAGRDQDGIPHYIQRPFSDEERWLLREHFGIEEPGRLYLSDTTAAAYLNNDTERDPGAGRLVRSYRVGAPTVRLLGETWEELERQLATLPRVRAPARRRAPRGSPGESGGDSPYFGNARPVSWSPAGASPSPPPPSTAPAAPWM
jgi:hypothetical protein